MQGRCTEKPIPSVQVGSGRDEGGNRFLGMAVSSTMQGSFSALSSRLDVCSCLYEDGDACGAAIPRRSVQGRSSTPAVNTIPVTAARAFVYPRIDVCSRLNEGPDGGGGLRIILRCKMERRHSSLSMGDNGTANSRANVCACIHQKRNDGRRGITFLRCMVQGPSSMTVLRVGICPGREASGDIHRAGSFKKLHRVPSVAGNFCHSRRRAEQRRKPQAYCRRKWPDSRKHPIICHHFSSVFSVALRQFCCEQGVDELDTFVLCRRPTSRNEPIRKSLLLALHTALPATQFRRITPRQFGHTKAWWSSQRAFPRRDWRSRRTQTARPMASAARSGACRYR